MAYLTPEVDEEFIDVDDPGSVNERDQLVNTKGASLNYTVWMLHAEGPFCADKNTLKGDE